MKVGHTKKKDICLEGPMLTWDFSRVIFKNFICSYGDEKISTVSKIDSSKKKMILSSQKIICMCPLDPPKHEKVFFMVGPHKRFMAGILPSRATKICFGRCQNIKHGIFGYRWLENVLSMASALVILHQPSSWETCHLQLMHWLW